MRLIIAYITAPFRVWAALCGFWWARWLEKNLVFNHAFGPEKIMDLNDSRPDKRAFARRLNKNRAAVKVAKSAGVCFWDRRWSADFPLTDPRKDAL